MSYINDISVIWEMVKASFAESLSQKIADLWFSELVIASFEDNEIVFTTDSPFKYKIINESYVSKIAEEFSRILGANISVKVNCTSEMPSTEQIKKQVLGKTDDLAENERPVVKEQKKIDAKLSLSNYNFEYTFDNFIVGNSNKFAHAACTAVAANPARDYNPLFIYGPSGLGKTHLMSAVVNEIRRKKTDLKVIYIKGEEFTNQLIESLSRQDMPAFRERYRNCDILLIDDIQFIAGKNSTQEEFFHTFNTLYEDRKQIILSSDRPPKDIQTLEDRLKTRFEWGLIADIEPPDLELRIAIIKKKAEQVNVSLSEEVLEFLAENLRSNIRQIEGAVRKLSALSFLSGKIITMEVAKSCLTELLGGAEPMSVTVDKVFSAVYKKYGVTKEDLIGTKRNKEIAFARHVSVYLIRAITEMSFPNIAKVFSRDHATIIASYEKIYKRISSDAVFNIEIEEMKKEVTIV